MACSLLGLRPHEEQLEVAPSLSLVSGPSPWLLWQSRQITYVVSGFPKSECARARVSKVSSEAACQHFCHSLWIRGGRGPSRFQGRAHRPQSTVERVVKESVGIVHLPQWLRELELDAQETLTAVPA